MSLSSATHAYRQCKVEPEIYQRAMLKMISGETINLDFGKASQYQRELEELHRDARSWIKRLDRIIARSRSKENRQDRQEARDLQRRFESLSQEIREVSRKIDRTVEAFQDTDRRILKASQRLLDGVATIGFANTGRLVVKNTGALKIVPVVTDYSKNINHNPKTGGVVGVGYDLSFWEYLNQMVGTYGSGLGVAAAAAGLVTIFGGEYATYILNNPPQNVHGRSLPGTRESAPSLPSRPTAEQVEIWHEYWYGVEDDEKETEGQKPPPPPSGQPNGKKDDEESDVSQDKRLEDILEGATSGRETKGKTEQWEKKGGYEEALRDFDDLNPKDIKDIETNYGGGKRGILPDGSRVNVRRSSTNNNSPTVEIQKPNGRRIKIRYR